MFSIVMKNQAVQYLLFVAIFGGVLVFSICYAVDNSPLLKKSAQKVK